MTFPLMSIHTQPDAAHKDIFSFSLLHKNVLIYLPSPAYWMTTKKLVSGISGIVVSIAAFQKNRYADDHRMPMIKNQLLILKTVNDQPYNPIVLELLLHSTI